MLMAADGPVDAAAEPAFDIPPATAMADETAWMAARTDVRLSLATQRAVERVWHDSSKDYFPTAIASFDPQALTPSGAFSTSQDSWRFAVSVSAADLRRRPAQGAGDACAKPRRTRRGFGADLASDSGAVRSPAGAGSRARAASARSPACGLPRSRRRSADASPTPRSRPAPRRISK